MKTPMDSLINKKITAIFFNKEHLKFSTNEGDFYFTVDGDCCSESYFHDFIGVKKLLEDDVLEAADA